MWKNFALRNISCTAVFRQGAPDAWKILKLVQDLDKKGLVVNLDKKDIKEHYSAGGKKGGQKANNAHTLVLLCHVPTGKVAEGRDTRTLPDNYKFAMARLRMAVDISLKGDESEFVKWKKENEERSRIKAELKRQRYQEKIENEAKLKAILNEEDELKY